MQNGNSGQKRDASAAWKPSAIEVCAWCALAWILALLLLHVHTPGFGNDGYQYLSVADNIARGNGIQTSIIYFDRERMHQTIPAPMVTFAPLYSVLIAALHRLGLSLENAGLLLSQVSFGILPLLVAAAALGGARPAATRAAMVLLIGNSTLLALAGCVASDALFTALITAALVCFSRSLAAARMRPAVLWQSAGWLLLGLSVWTRYAGLIVLAAAVLFFVFELAVRRDRRAVLQVLTSLLAMALAAALMARDSAVSGSWRGGVSKAGPHTWHLRPVVVAIYHALFGELRIHAGMEGLVLAAGCALLLTAAFLKPRGRGYVARGASPFWLLLTVVLAVYCGGLVYADATMVVSVSARYVDPILPAFLLLLCALPSKPETKSSRTVHLLAVVLIVAGYLGYQARSAWQIQPSVPHLRVREAFLGDAGGAAGLASWVQTHVAPGEVLTATDGQATAYELHRPVLCLADPGFSSQRWDEGTIAGEMSVFHSRYLVLYPHLAADVAPVQESSPFLRGILSTGAVDPLSGFRIVARNKAVMILAALPGS